MRESREPSYYEVALTSKQVGGALLVLFACLFGAFLGGLWVGRAGQVGAQEPALRVAQARPVPIRRSEPAEPRTVTPGEEGLPRLDTTAVAPAEAAPSTLAEEVGLEGDAVEAGGPGAEGSPLGDEPVPERGETPEPPPPASTTPTPGPADPAGVPRWKQRLDTQREAARLEQEFAAATGSQPGSETAEPAPVAAAPAPSPKVTPVEPAPAVAPTGPVHVIQVLVTRDRARAQQLLERLRGNGYPAALSTFTQQGSQLHRVRIGPYREKKRADAIATEVRTKLQLDTWVTTETP